MRSQTLLLRGRTVVKKLRSKPIRHILAVRGRLVKRRVLPSLGLEVDELVRHYEKREKKDNFHK